MPVLVYVENAEGRFKKSTFEVISYARALADKLGTELIALSIGNVDEKELSDLGTYGTDRILSAKSAKLSTFQGEAYSSTIAQAAREKSTEVILLSNTFNGKTLAPAVAAKLKAGLVTAAIELPGTEAGKFIVRRTAFSGKAITDVELTSAVKVITVSLNSFEVQEAGRTPATEQFEPSLSDSDFAVTVKETLKTTDKVPLPEAEIVVSGGRGLKGPENWHLIEELAEVLGGAIACSKPVSDAGWRPHEEHVGQTGITVSPNLYLAVGISGAIQHIAGISSSKTIVVINKDPEAPFFKVADYGIVGDAFEVVPKLIESIKEFKAKG